MRWLAQEYPQLVDGYAQLYARKYAPAAYRKEVHDVDRHAADEVRNGRARRGQTTPQTTAEPSSR